MLRRWHTLATICWTHLKRRGSQGDRVRRRCERGRRFFTERGAARDLAYFVRSPRIKALRRELKRDPSAVLPAAVELARRFSSRVMPLSSAADLPPAGRIGVWTDRKRRLVATRAVGGRRLFVELRSGRIIRHNLEELAFVF